MAALFLDRRVQSEFSKQPPLCAGTLGYVYTIIDRLED